MPGESFAALSERLCPWLRAPLLKLESAHASARLGHAWLLAGPRGLGKVNLALVFADRLLRGSIGRSQPAELTAAEAVAAMRERHLPADHHPDLHWLFPEDDKRSIGVEQIRAVTDALALKGFKGGAKVLIIEPAEAMTTGAANALLKSLEEPSGDTYMLLVSHQPGRLPSTIRSRCQMLPILGPENTADETHDWRSRAERAPLVISYRAQDDYTSFINELDDSINLISDSRRDPQAVADEWLKRDLEAVLDWLVGRIQRTIRTRIVGRASNPVTEAAAGVMHNPWNSLTIGALFEQLEAAERLRDQLGGGINAELALRVLLLKFLPERGRL